MPGVSSESLSEAVARERDGALSPLAPELLVGTLTSMEHVAEFPHAARYDSESGLRLLIADDDGPARSLLASAVRDVFGEVVVLEAADGSEAVQLGVQQRPAIALLDVNMPRLGGVEAAITLRELQPRMRLALQTPDPLTHREQAREHRLPLFDKLELDHTLAWLRIQTTRYRQARPDFELPAKRSLVCAGCGYGILRAASPERCPMCQAENAWIDAPSQRSVALSLR